MGHGSGGDAVASTRERRRLSVKAAKVERRKEEAERAIMAEEDRCSKVENDAFLVRRWIQRCLRTTKNMQTNL